MDGAKNLPKSAREAAVTDEQACAFTDNSRQTGAVEAKNCQAAQDVVAESSLQCAEVRDDDRPLAAARSHAEPEPHDAVNPGRVRAAEAQAEGPPKKHTAGRRGAGRAWSSKSLASRRKHMFFYFLLRHGGLLPARILLFFVVLVYTLRPAVARRIYPYLERRFGPASFITRRLQAWRLYRSFGNVLLERAATGILGASNIISRPEDVARMRELMAEGRGLIMLNAHVGIWQTAVSGLPPGVTVNIAMLRDGADVDLQFFEHGRNEDWPEIRLVDMGGPFGGFLEMSAALRRGEVLCIMGDRVNEKDRLKVTVDFLGGKIQVPQYPYLLASMLGTPVLCSFVRRTGSMSGKTLSETIIRVPERVERSDKALRPYAQAYADAVEEFVNKHPEQFFNFYDMWIN